MSGAMTGAAAIIIAASTAITDESTLIEVEFVSTFLMTLLSARFLPQRIALAGERCTARS